ncbi:unnamed protein product [Brachionus calyciflorus]|uniref:Uncharacterized protein n=1 Tax=Brachionus calyciflorus TaxID=104777 RepID=A0A813XJM3_9BILA|nr:unnamed protein product [Brachionus calyciflorus]
MQFTQVVYRLSNHIRYQHIPGNILNGKHRIWPKLTPKHKRVLLRDIDREINNMKLISRPFITEEQSKVVFDQLNKEKSEKEFLAKLEKVRSNKNKLEDKRMSDHLDPLRYHRVWE